MDLLVFHKGEEECGPTGIPQRRRRMWTYWYSTKEKKNVVLLVFHKGEEECGPTGIPQRRRRMWSYWHSTKEKKNVDLLVFHKGEEECGPTGIPQRRRMWTYWYSTKEKKNVDLLVFHKEELIVVDPSQTLTSIDDNILRSSAVEVIRHLTFPFLALKFNYHLALFSRCVT